MNNAPLHPGPRDPATPRPRDGGPPLPWFLRALRVLPPRVAKQLGGALGELFGRLPMRDQRRCREHLARGYPQADAAWVERTARRCFRHVGGMALWTVATIPRDPFTLRRQIMVEGAENAHALLRRCRRGQGTMIASGHLGNWELLPRVGGTVIPLSVIGRRLRWPWADAMVRRIRESGGARQLDQDVDIRALVRELRQGRPVGTLPDQDVPRLAGVFVPWFGIPAYTPVGPAALAGFADGYVIPVFMLERQGRWVLHCGPLRHFPRSRDRAADQLAITAWFMRYEEALVRQIPHQWVWWHRRWRTRPEDRPGA